MSHVTRMDESRTYGGLGLRIRDGHYTHVKTEKESMTIHWKTPGSCVKSVTSHIRMHHVIHTDESCYTYRCVISHICKSHVTHRSSRHASVVYIYVCIHMYVYVCIVYNTHTHRDREADHADEEKGARQLCVVAQQLEKPSHLMCYDVFRHVP